MNIQLSKPYTLPPIEFVGGSTQEFQFSCYFLQNKEAFDLSSCTAYFAIINYVNKSGEPLVTKSMSVSADSDDEDAIANILNVTLDSADTLELAGKYIYQITVKDSSGEIDIPNQGLMHIIRNIDKASAQ